MKSRRNLIVVTAIGLTLASGPALIAQNQPAQSTATATQPSLSNQQTVNFSSIPSQAQQSLRKHTGQAQLTSVNRATWTGTAYQAGFEKNGHHFDMQVAPDGTILNNTPIHTVNVHLANASNVSYDQLPAPVKNTLTRHVGSSGIATLKQGTWTGTIFGAAPTQGSSPIWVTADGSAFRSGSSVAEAAGATTTPPAVPAPGTTPTTQVPGAAPGGYQTAPGTTTTTPAPTPPPAAAPPGTPSATTSALSFKDLPWTVQKPMLDTSGWASIPNVSQSTLPDGRTAYTGYYQKNGQNFQITVDQNGNVVSNQATGPAAQ